MPGLARSLRLALVVCVVAPGAARAQSLQDVLTDLFVFSGGENPLFLGASAGLPGIEVHGDHFIPSESETNGALLDFFNDAIASNVASFPLSSTVSSETFVLVGGVPQPTSNSFGPIFAERAQTIGRGRLNAALNFSRIRFSEIRGTDLEDIRLAFVHSNVDFPGCDEFAGGDCGQYGVPQFENDVIDFALDLQLEAELYALSVTFGATDWLDLSVAVPVVDLRLEGTSVASVAPTTEEALHIFGGTPENPVLEDRTSASEGATGIGDVAARIKARVVESEPWRMALLGEIRAPTGREEDFLGTGEVGARGLLILSGVFEGFAPHANVGYAVTGGELSRKEVELIAGFDHRLADWATLAVDVLGSFPVGDDRLEFPEPVRIEAPFPHTVERTNIPNRDDEIVDGSIGFKFRTGAGLVVVTNVLVPLNDGGLRASPIPTLGLEYSP